MSLAKLLRRLRDNVSGVAVTEFALSAPFLLGFGMWGIETANLALTNMRVSQLAMHIADNASRIGDTSSLEDRKIYEGDINDLLYGAHMQGGGGLDLYKFGRVIVSSLEVEDESGEQYIHWQRCKGERKHDSSYGKEGDDLGAKGMGPAGHEVLAQEGDAVIFVELNYAYQPLVSDMFVSNTAISATSAFTVRDDRDLSEVYQSDPAAPDPVSRCNVYDSFPAT